MARRDKGCPKGGLTSLRRAKERDWKCGDEEAGGEKTRSESLDRWKESSSWRREERWMDDAGGERDLEYYESTK